MIPNEWLNALIGGVLIGIAVSVMLLMNGRVTGISGIINGALHFRSGDSLWRFLFLGGLLVGGVVMGQANPDGFQDVLGSPLWIKAVAGFLVGIGTIMGSGCTSGHGVCGISRLSLRSIVATVTFIGAGALAVLIFRRLGVFV